MNAEARAAEVAALAALSDHDLVLAFEQEMAPETLDTEAERALMRRFFNLARAGAGLPQMENEG